MKKCHTGFTMKRTGHMKRKSVRGCIVGDDIKVLNLVIVEKGAEDIPGVTDAKGENRLGPKRANKIRKLFGADTKANVTKLVIRRAIVKGEKTYYKAPKIQRLITDVRLRRKKIERS